MHESPSAGIRLSTPHTATHSTRSTHITHLSEHAEQHFLSGLRQSVHILLGTQQKDKQSSLLLLILLLLEDEYVFIHICLVL